VGEFIGASGADVLRAYCIGFEVAGRIGEALGRSHYEAGWHPTATLGTLGATAVAAALLGSNPEVWMRAIGIACSEAAGTRMNFGTDTKPLHAGLAAQAGITAAELAQRGVTARADALEAHMGFAALYAGASARVRLDRDLYCLVDPGIEHKPYPSCRFTHRIIEAVARLRERHGRQNPASLTCTMDPFARQILIYPRASSALEAKFSMPWCAALTWLDGPPTVDTFRDDRVRRPDVAQLVRRVDVIDGSADSETVEVAFADGTRDSETITLPLGHSLRPLSREQHLRKLHACMEPCLGIDRAQRVIPVLERIDEAPSVRNVLAGLRSG
jgi:2-methylcitrate dehydratase PrpD